jgi:ferredoxin-NADP reductase
LPREFSITSVRRATPTTRIVRVQAGRDFTYRAGHAAELGPLDAETLSPYSIASAPEDTLRDGQIEFLIRIHAQGRWGTRYDFEQPRRGQRLQVTGPLGDFTFPDSPAARSFLFIAGGTGISPIRSMLRHALAVDAGRLRVLYSARTPLDFAYRTELSGMARRGEIGLTLTATRDVTGAWRGGRGRITRAQLEPLVVDDAMQCFVCGPVAMVDEVPRLLQEIGIDRKNIRVEEW